VHPQLPLLLLLPALHPLQLLLLPSALLPLPPPLPLPLPLVLLLLRQAAVAAAEGLAEGCS
jgi:hypothetical protein